MNDRTTDPPSGGQPPAFPPYPPPSNPPVVNVPVQPQPQFDNPDETIAQVMQPVADEDSSSEDRALTEPIRLQMKQRHISHDSDDKPPKAKAKVQVKKQKVQLPGHQQGIVPPTVKPPEFEDDGPHPTASSSNDSTLPLPTPTPHSFTPSPTIPDDTADYDTPQSGSQGTIQYHDPEDETEEPVLNEEEIEHLQSEDSESTRQYESEFVQFDGDYFVLLGHRSAAPDFQSYDVKGFQKFGQYLAKNGKKAPKSEAVITPAILQQYAKQVKQAKLEEFRSFLDFTAMKLRDRKRKIEIFVTGRWVLTIKTFCLHSLLGALQSPIVGPAAAEAQRENWKHA